MSYAVANNIENIFWHSMGLLSRYVYILLFMQLLIYGY